MTDPGPRNTPTASPGRQPVAANDTTSPQEQTAEMPDVFFLSASLDRMTVQRFYEAHLRSPRGKQCVLVLTTDGGDAHAAYIIARYLRRNYEKLTICVFGYCKSAGTLLALGAHELVIGERGELGPLDCPGVHQGRNSPLGVGTEDIRVPRGPQGLRL